MFSWKVLLREDKVMVPITTENSVHKSRVVLALCCEIINPLVKDCIFPEEITLHIRIWYCFIGHSDWKIDLNLKHGNFLKMELDSRFISYMTLGKWSKLPLPKCLHLLDEDSDTYLEWFLGGWKKKMYKSPPAQQKASTQLKRCHRQNNVQAIIILRGAALQLLRAAAGVHSLNSISFREFQWDLCCLQIFMEERMDWFQSRLWSVPWWCIESNISLWKLFEQGVSWLNFISIRNYYWIGVRYATLE